MHLNNRGLGLHGSPYTQHSPRTLSKIGDRLIPVREGYKCTSTRYHLHRITQEVTHPSRVDLMQQSPADFARQEYIKRLKNVWQELDSGERVFSFLPKGKQYLPAKTPENHWPVKPRPKPYNPMPRARLDLPNFVFGPCSVDWDTSGNIVATFGSNIAVLKLYEPNETKEITKLSSKDGFCTSLKLSLTGELLAFGTNYSKVILWKLGDMKPINEWHCPCNIIDPGDPSSWYNACVITGMEWHPLKKYVASCCSTGMLSIWNSTVPEKIPLCKTELPGGIFEMKFSPSGHHVAASGETGYVWIYKFLDYRLEHIWKIRLSKSTTTALAWHPWQPHLLATGCGASISVWNVASRTIVATWKTKIPCSVDALTFSNRTGELVASIHVKASHRENQKTGGCKLLVLSSLDKVEDWINIYLDDQVGSTDVSLASLTWSPDGWTLAGADTTETLSFWNFSGEGRGTDKITSSRCTSPFSFLR